MLTRGMLNVDNLSNRYAICKFIFSGKVAARALERGWKGCELWEVVNWEEKKIRPCGAVPLWGTKEGRKMNQKTGGRVEQKCHKLHEPSVRESVEAVCNQCAKLTTETLRTAMNAIKPRKNISRCCSVSFAFLILLSILLSLSPLWRSISSAFTLLCVDRRILHWKNSRPYRQQNFQF